MAVAALIGLSFAPNGNNFVGQRPAYSFFDERARDIA
jgi:hypothetical protein